MKGNNSIIKYEKNIFIKIFDFFKNKFKQIQNRKNHEEKNIVTDEIPINSINEEKRKETLELYNKLKNGKVDINTISIKDLRKFNILLKEEIRLKKEKVAIQNKKLENIKHDISKLEYENNKLNEQYKNIVT